MQPTLADNEIARHCGVHHSLVASVRKRLEGEGEIAPAPIREHTRAGTPIQQRVSAPTRRQGAAQEAPQEIVDQAATPWTDGEPPIDEGTAVAVIKRYRRLRYFPTERAALLLPEGEEGMTAEEVEEIANWFAEVSEIMATAP
jgi:hypothetical protein